jgi:hypothetical protein
MKRVVMSLALVLGLGMTQAIGQEVEQAIESQPKQGVVGKIIDDLKESTRTVHEINKENVAAERQAFRARHSNATEPNPDFVSFRQAKGLKNKWCVVVASISEGCRENSEKERERREQIRSHEGYRTLLEEQRTKRETAINRG